MTYFTIGMIITLLIPRDYLLPDEKHGPAAITVTFVLCITLWPFIVYKQLKALVCR